LIRCLPQRKLNSRDNLKNRESLRALSMQYDLSPVLHQFFGRPIPCHCSLQRLAFVTWTLTSHLDTVSTVSRSIVITRKARLTVVIVVSVTRRSCGIAASRACGTTKLMVMEQHGPVRRPCAQQDLVAVSWHKRSRIDMNMTLVDTAR
jgi:hypothetical protein